MLFSCMGSNHDRLNQNQKCYHYTTGNNKLPLPNSYLTQIYNLRLYFTRSLVSGIGYKI